MRILNEDTSAKLDRVALYLTLAEARELRDSLDGLLNKPQKNHAHVSDQDFKKEVTLCIYDEKDLGEFNERSKKLIRQDQ